MKKQQFANRTYRTISTTIAMKAIVVLFLLLSCNNEKKHVESNIEEPDSIAYLSTYGVTTLISDSGRISYKIEAEEWHIYEKRNTVTRVFKRMDRK